MRSQSESARRSLGAEAVVAVVDMFGRTRLFRKRKDCAIVLWRRVRCQLETVAVSLYINVLILANWPLGGFAFRTENRQQVAIGIEDMGSPHGPGNRNRLPLESHSLLLERFVRCANGFHRKYDFRLSGRLFGRASPIFAHEQYKFSRVEEIKPS